MKIKRRSFLKGLVAAVTGATALDTLSAKSVSLEQVTNGEVTKHLEEKMLDLQPATPHVGLTCDGWEIDGDGYKRVPHNDWKIEDGQVSNREITFPKATGAWGNVTGFIITDALENGNKLAFGNFAHWGRVGKNDITKIEAGEIYISLS